MKTNNTQNNASRESFPKSIPAIIGAGIIVIAGLILIETAVKTGWLLAVGMFISGLLLLIGGIWLKKALLLFSGCIFTSFGIGLLIQAAGINLFETQTLIGLLLAQLWLWLFVDVFLLTSSFGQYRLVGAHPGIFDWLYCVRFSFYHRHTV